MTNPITNRESTRQRGRLNSAKYRRANLGKVRASAREYAKLRDPKRHLESMRAYHLRNRLKVISILGEKCVHCGIADHRVLQIDHKNGGGNRERLLNHPVGIYRRIINGKADLSLYQLLCANCNWIKRFEHGESRRRG